MLAEAMQRIMQLLIYPIRMLQQVVLITVNGYDVSLFSLIMTPIVVGFAFIVLILFLKGRGSNAE